MLPQERLSCIRSMQFRNLHTWRNPCVHAVLEFGERSRPLSAFDLRMQIVSRQESEQRYVARSGSRGTHDMCTFPDRYNKLWRGRLLLWSQNEKKHGRGPRKIVGSEVLSLSVRFLEVRTVFAASKFEDGVCCKEMCGRHMQYSGRRGEINRGIWGTALVDLSPHVFAYGLYDISKEKYILGS